MPVLKRDENYHTYADYFVWSRTFGDEVIDGVAYSREPQSQGWIHQAVVGGLLYEIGNALRERTSHWYVTSIDVRLPKFSHEDDQVDTVVQPDLLIVCDRLKLDERGVCGAPDWLAEVLSPDTASHDQIVKLPAYERAGVREVWLIQPVDRTLAVYHLGAGRYGRPTILELKGQTQLVAVPDVTIDWDRVLANIG